MIDEKQVLEDLKKQEIEKKKEELQRTFEETIDSVIESAKEEGLSVYQWLQKHYQELDTDTVLSGLYDDFMDLHIHKIPSDISGKIPETFEDYLRDSLKVLNLRLQALHYNKRNRISGFDKLKKTGVLSEIEDLPKGFGEPLRPEDIEFFELIMRKTKEIIEEYLRNPSIWKK